MALTRFFFATSLLFLSSLIIASATNYGYSPQPNPDNAKPDEHSYNHSPQPNFPDNPKLNEQDSGYSAQPNPDNAKPDEQSYNQSPQPNFPDNSKLNEQNSSYSAQPGSGYPKADEQETPIPIAVEGLILCKSGPTYVPIPGAVARITCLAVNDQGYETAPFSVLSGAADAKGYFFATLCPSKVDNEVQITECKAFLENSPLDTCNVPTDVNKGISGAVLTSSRLLKTNKVELYSVGPFFYTSELPQATPTGY